MRFNTTDNFDGVLDFAIDSIYQFSTDVAAEIQSPIQGFDYRLIYDAYAGLNVGSYTDSTRTIFMVWMSDGMFGQYSIDILSWHFGRARGCIGLEWVTVKAAQNPVNKQAYTGVKSIMNWPYGESAWDEYSINVINYYAEKVYYGPNLIESIYPASCGVVVRSGLGEPVANATVNLYGIAKRTFTVDTPAVVTGVTDASGEFVLTGNPYNPDAAGPLEYLNFLITAVNDNDTAYNWMSVNEIGNVWFANPDSAYRLLVHF